MGLKRLWYRIFRKTKKPPLGRVDQGTPFIETPELSTLSRGGYSAVNPEVTDGADVSVNENGFLSPFYLHQNQNEYFLPPSTNPNDTPQVALQVGQCSTTFRTPLPDFPNPFIEDTETALFRNGTEPYETHCIPAPSLQSIQPKATPSDQYHSSPPTEASNPWYRNFTLKNLTRRARRHQSTTVDPSREANVIGNELPNHLAAFGDEETFEELSRFVLSVDEFTDSVVVDASNRAQQHRDHDEGYPNTIQIDEEQVDHRLYEYKSLPEIPQQETVSVLEPEEVILYPRKAKLEVLHQQLPSSVQVNDNETHELPTTLPEMEHGPVFDGSLVKPKSTPKPSFLWSFFPLSASEYFINEDPLAVSHARPLEVTQRGARGAPQYLYNFLYSSPPASELPPIESFLPVKKPTRPKYSLRNSFFSSLDVCFKGNPTYTGGHSGWHPWNVRFVGQGASGKVFRVAYKNEIWDPDGKIPGESPIAFGAESQEVSVKVIDMKNQTEATLLGLVSEVIALKMLSKERNDIAEAKAKNRRVRHPDGPRYLLESAYLPGIDDTAVLRADRLYLLTKFYHCDLSNYGSKICNDEKSLSFILSELTQGLNYLHNIGMVHLDLKPSNIFVTQDRHCVIGDLGSSIYRPGSILAHQAGILVDAVTSYTDGFCAPEIALSPSHSDRFNFKADFWSLGVTIYDILLPDALNLPGMGQYDPEEEWRRRKDYDGMGLDAKYMANMMYNVGCPGRIVSLVLNLCQRDPKKRLGGRGVLRNLKDQLERLHISRPCDPSPLPNLFIPRCDSPRHEEDGSYVKMDVKEACKILKERIEREGYELLIEE